MLDFLYLKYDGPVATWELELLEALKKRHDNELLRPGPKK